jgi:hypothetical protein
MSASGDDSATCFGSCVSSRRASREDIDRLDRDERREDIERYERTVFDISTTASSPRSFSTHRDDAYSAEVDAIAPEASNENSVLGLEAPLFRQLSMISMQTGNSPDAEEATWPVVEEEYEAPASWPHAASVDIVDFMQRAPNIRFSDTAASGDTACSPSLKLPGVYAMQPQMVYAVAPITSLTIPTIINGAVSKPPTCPADLPTILSTNPTWHVTSGGVVGASIGNAADRHCFQQGAQPIQAYAAYAGHAPLNDPSSGPHSGSSTPPESIGYTQCQLFWCDPRAFKETLLKDQLESEMHVSVKCYRTADMCMRLLRKKQHIQSKNNFRIFLVSWANAPALVAFLDEEQFLASKVIILCDTCGSKGCSRACAWAQQHPLAEVAYTWDQAVDVMMQCVSNL